MLDVCLLGTGGMMPLPDRFLTSLLCRLNGRMLLIDCGEGTQVTMRMLGWGFKNLGVICVTHFHADHLSGLPGLLLTIGNAGRTEPLHIVGPAGLAAVLECLLVIAPDLPFDVVAVELSHNEPAENMDIGGFLLSAHPMAHRIPCFGYSLCVKRQGRFDLARAQALGLPKPYWSKLQKGETVSVDSAVYTPDMVLGEPRKGIKLTYCTDSRPPKGVEDFARGSDLFICEGLYGDEGLAEKAAKHRHMTYREAAEIAKRAAVSELWLTHFSPAMTDPKAFWSVAADVFPNTKVGADRMTRTIFFEG